MANTTYDEIFNNFLVNILDYRIDSLYANSLSDFNDYLLGFMKKAIAKFDSCNQDLTDRDDDALTFNITLTPLEIEIISGLMVLEYLLKEINDITQMRIHLGDTDFKYYSEAQNLKEKKAHRQELREEIDNLITRYNLKNVPWTEWSQGNYENS